MTIQAIVRNSHTVTMTFTSTPSPELRKQLQAQGFTFRTGQWVKNEATSFIHTEEVIAQQLAA